jgi:hypothetical protein
VIIFGKKVVCLGLACDGVRLFSTSEFGFFWFGLLSRFGFKSALIGQSAIGRGGQQFNRVEARKGLFIL